MLSVFMVCVGGPGNKNHTGILRLLEALFSESLPPAEKKKILQDEFDINMSRAFETEVSEMCNLSQGVLEKGMEKGQQNEFERSVRSMRKAGLENTKIAALLEKDLTVVQAVK